jgi:preprotein translocase subunit SecE
MNTKAIPPEKLDTIRWLIVLLLVVGGMVGFYYFDEQWIWVRILGLLAVIGIAGFVAAKTEKGHDTLIFIRESHTEVRKVIWPTPQETMQVTGIVIVMVVLVAIFIWILDSVLMWIVRLLTGSGG